MKCSTLTNDLFSLSALTREPDYGTRILDVLPTLGDASDTQSAIAAFRQILRLMGADAGVFMSVIKDDSTRTSHRSLVACDPLWATEYTRSGWHEHDPWLRHALNDSEPILGSDLDVRLDEAPFVAMAARLGFSSSVIVPAPSSAGTSRVAVLAIGSHNLTFFDSESSPILRVIARALAMELNRWLARSIREELLAGSGITPDELALLRHEDEGHTSKMIGAALNIESTAVDCRFQRVTMKLDAPDRRTAARIARLYGLI